MKISDFDFELENNRIATTPVSPRDHSRLLVLDKENGNIEHKKFFDILSYLNKGDLLVLNNSKVFPARLLGKTQETGRKIEIFLLNKEEKTIWKCLLGGKKIKAGLRIEISEEFIVEVISDNNDGTWLVDFYIEENDLMKSLNEVGKIPLPPYIEKQRKVDNLFVEVEKDKKNYQTVFADDEKKGSVAAPTAGLHFTDELIEKIKEKGIAIEYITLHVGMGTFAPVKVDDPKKHKMHSEWVEIKEEVVDRINKTKANGGRVIAVGTTTTRSLEALINTEFFEKGSLDSATAPLKMTGGDDDSKIQKLQSWVDIFIYPGYRFKVVDAMVTNFHLPKSTLLMLVSALAGKQNIDKAYKEAIDNDYRFYSYGDAMFIK